MTRRIVSYTPSGAYVGRNVRWTAQNYPKILMEAGEQTSVMFDLTKYLEANETITAANVESHGTTPTLTISADALQVTASNITPANGYANLTFTTSSGEKITTKLYVEKRCGPSLRDYTSGMTYI